MATCCLPKGTNNGKQLVLNFDNKALRCLPLDTVKENAVRQVPNACFSRVLPASVVNPKVVCLAREVLDLLDVPAELDESCDELGQYLSGNQVLPGSEPAAHCYCGHQFGHFAGQLGDGATMYLGEIVNQKKERWEIQFKGAGKTPFSRSADGRKVLRSSLREFLCSEANFHLGVPTTRAASCVTSDSRVVRDIFYSGNPIQERCTIIMRVAPTFIRFGSFEIARGGDPYTGRRGPSSGNFDIIRTLLDYVTETFYPEIHAAHSQDRDARSLAFFGEVVRRTARLVAKWQCVGFCHGVLNTDNMSIVGVTIDYGPFGFMDRFDRDFICNASDDGGRYTYAAQPEICRWNCSKLAESLDPAMSQENRGKLEQIVEAEYWSTYNEAYLTEMKRKLGLIEEVAEDKSLIESLFNTMQSTGSDFTLTFLALSALTLHPTQPGFDSQLLSVQSSLVKCSCSLEVLKQARKPKLSKFERQLIMMLMREGNQEDIAQILGREEDEEIKDWTPEIKKSKDTESWSNWLKSFKTRLERENPNNQSERTSLMRSANPRVVLRNYLAEEAISLAEKGDFSGARILLDRLRHPFMSDAEWANLKSGEKADSCSAPKWELSPPQWASEIKVT